MKANLTNLIDVIEFCRSEGLPGQVVGRWVWLEFDEKPSAAIREKLKAAGFIWIHSRGKWAHNCGHPSRKGACTPWIKYGAVPILDEKQA